MLTGCCSQVVIRRGPPAHALIGGRADGATHSALLEHECLRQLVHLCSPMHNIRNMQRRVSVMREIEATW